MTIACFEATAYTQFAVRCNTGIHPDDLSLGVNVVSEQCTMERAKRYMDAGLDVPPEFSAFDAMDWETAVALAEWILKYDKEFKRTKVEE